MRQRIQWFGAVLASVLLALTSASVIAQNRGQGQGKAQGQGRGQQAAQQQPAQQRQAERTSDQQRAKDQSRDRVHQPGAAEANGQAIYGGNLMTQQEQKRYREELRSKSTVQQRNEYISRHHEQMEARSRQRNVPIEVTSE
ncbi:MAG TPA: hypothetical protein VLM41_02100 [Steroidobacteraceae bacterium]|nr:hypothetical protein [Steroidobacteraceae bacterium]